MKDDIYGTFKKRNTDSSYGTVDRSTHSADWATGHWENLPDQRGQATFIRDKEHLRKECDRRGVLAKGLLKPTSQGKGWEMSKSSAGRVWI